VFVLTYVGMAMGRVPGLRIDRAGIAFAGATGMLVCGVVSFEQAIGQNSVDYKTLALLLGMMVVIAFLRLSRVFEQLTQWTLRRIRTPWGLLAVTISLSGVLSAFLINDIVCLSMTPLVLRLARRMGFDPVPHLIGLATAANIGSMGTITGNPQNIYIGSHSGIPYLRFALRLLPVAALGLVVNFLVVAIVYRRNLQGPSDLDYDPPGRRAVVSQSDASDSQNSKASMTAVGHAHRWLRCKSITVALATIVLFFTGLPLELIALGAASLLLLLGQVRSEKVYRHVDWSLLVMFTGLFIVVHAFQVHVVSHWRIERWTWLLHRPVDLLSAVSALLSNVVSNVPAVLLLNPLVHAMPPARQETAWLALAMSSTLAGNLTVLGSVANLIVVENAQREGITVSFRQYCLVGVPLTIITLVLGIIWLELVHY
jgi:Na+/H+ antiporter NhaD/arsenite permease-like protein